MSQGVTDEQKQRLADAHGVETYDDLPHVVRNMIEADGTRLTEQSYQPQKPLEAMGDHVAEGGR